MTGALPEAEPSPAERYASARARRGSPRMEAFRSGLDHDLDPFQAAACRVLEEGRSVLVAAPTGAGKTIVAEFAIHLAMFAPRDKVFYTTPMKALSNQKYAELARAYGSSEVGLLTGDSNVNSSARIVVMTTEVLRNMLYADSPLLRDLRYVVLDEVHFLADRFRGAVWEEVIIHLPREVRMVSLSATVSNAEEFGDWLQAVRGETDVIVSEQRPVPLDQHVLVRSKLLDLFDSSGQAATDRVNPELVRPANAGGRSLEGRASRDLRRTHYRDRGRPGFGDRIDRPEVVKLLAGRTLLPAIFFVFSRAGCDQAVTQVLRSGIRLTEQWERELIREIAEERCRTIRDDDLSVLGYWDWLEGLSRGVAAHHAGLIPAFKEVVEELFQRKLVKVVFATETLALGINMPARTVVLEKLDKFNGESRAPITPGEYTQLTGRAGRRGIDVEGHSVIQWTPGLNPQAVASLASRRSYPLNSSFRPTYNMAVNLIAQFGRDRAREVLESSFAQFQADRSVVDIARKVRRQEESLKGYEDAMRCHLGDFREYATLRRELSDLERAGGRDRAGTKTDADRRQRRITSVRTRMKQHPCHGCAEREAHARWAERWFRLDRDTAQLRRQIDGRTGAVAQVFDRVVDVLRELGYLSGEGAAVEVAEAGRTLRRIYGERDLLVAECLRVGAWNGLDASGLAAMAACLVYEPRREGAEDVDPRLPKGGFRRALEETDALWARLGEIEAEHRIPGTGVPARGLALATWNWAEGGRLDAVLRDAGLAAGDFVRWMKQAIDLLDQVSIVADGPVGRIAREAIDRIGRGIVADRPSRAVQTPATTSGTMTTRPRSDSARPIRSAAR